MTKENVDLAHFLLHTGSKKIAKNRYVWKISIIIGTNYEKAKEELLEYFV